MMNLRHFLALMLLCSASLLHAKGQESLNLRRGGYKQVPEVVWQTDGLRVLDLSKNDIVELPDSIASLQLSELRLQRTYVTAFPAAVKDSPLARSLRLLDMRGCRLTEAQQGSIKELFPNTKILWDDPCECGAD